MAEVGQRPAHMLLDIGGTLLREHDYDLARGVAALRPRTRERELLRELNAEVARVHESNSAEFTLRAWLLRNRAVFAAEGEVGQLELTVWRESVPMSPMPGAATALAFLASEGIGLACVSNAVFSGSILAYELARHGLESSLRFVLSSADLGVRKPAEPVFSAALARLGAQPADTWFVGDSWENDVEGAAQAGLLPVWLGDGVPPVADFAFLQATSWLEIRRLVAEATR